MINIKPGSQLHEFYTRWDLRKPNNLCQLVRKTLFSMAVMIFGGTIAAFMAVGLILNIFALFGILSIPSMMAGSVPLQLFGMFTIMGGIAYGIGIVVLIGFGIRRGFGKVRRNMAASGKTLPRIQFREDGIPSLAWQWLVAVKKKTCPLVNFD